MTSEHFLKVSKIVVSKRDLNYEFLSIQWLSDVERQNQEFFDADFFGVTDFEANYMDAQIRAMLETTYEAICDSGTL